MTALFVVLVVWILLAGLLIAFFHGADTRRPRR
jgi:hypothetical protein